MRAFMAVWAADLERLAGSKWVWRCLLILGITYSALISLPPLPKSYGTGLDPSWIVGLNWAHAQGMVAGRDVVFSYGPLGYLVFPDPISDAPGTAFFYRVSLYFLTIAALCRLSWIMPSKAAAVFIALIFGLGVSLDAQPEENQIVLTFTATAILVLVERSGWRYLVRTLLGFLAALGCLVKLNQGLEMGALFLTVACTVSLQGRPLDRHAKRQLLLSLGLFPVSAAVLFLASTGSLAALGPYAKNGWLIVTGYSETMGLPGSLWQAGLAVATILTTFGVLLVAADRRALLPGFAPALIAGFFVFKHAMVRQSGRAPEFHIKFAVALVFLMVCAKLGRDRLLILILQLFSVAMTYACVVEQYPGFHAEIQARLRLRKAPATLAGFLHWSTVWNRVGSQNDRDRQKLRLPDRVHQLIQTDSVDAVPWDIDVVRANGWKWQPQPVFQSYTAYTPDLDRLNAEHLESTRTATFVLLNFAAIDGRHPFLETPLSWRSLLDRYDLTLSSTAWLLLRHRLGPKFGMPLPLGHSTALWDRDIPVPPSSGWLMMGPHINASWSGRATSFLFRSAAVYLEGAFTSGRQVRWRCVPRNLAGGFLVHPFPQNLEEMRPLFQPVPALDSGDRIKSIRFHTESPGEFAPEIPIDWYRLAVTASAEKPIPPPYPLAKASLTPLWLPHSRPPRPTHAQLQVRRNWIEATPDTDDPQLLFDIGPALGKFGTVIVRARFQKADRIDAFFGKQIDGRGVSGVVPMPDQWVDVYLNMAGNMFWNDEHGTTLRFDPVSSAGPGTTAYIAGVWGSPEVAPVGSPAVQFFPVPPAEAPTR